MVKADAEAIREVQRRHGRSDMAQALEVWKRHGDLLINSLRSVNWLLSSN